MTLTFGKLTYSYLEGIDESIILKWIPKRENISFQSTTAINWQTGWNRCSAALSQDVSPFHGSVPLASSDTESTFETM